MRDDESGHCISLPQAIGLYAAVIGVIFVLLTIRRRRKEKRREERLAHARIRLLT